MSKTNMPIITIRPKQFTGHTHWEKKMYGVILVEHEDMIEPLWKLLCEQDDYWENYKEVIQVAPKEIDSESDISRMCVYAGKTDIDDVEAIRAKVPFVMYQEHPRHDY